MSAVFLSLAATVLFSGSLAAQSRVTVSGTVTDARSGEFLPSATVLLLAGSERTGETEEKPLQYRSTSMEGGFEFAAVPAGSFRVRVEYMGYRTYEQVLHLDRSPVRLEVRLEPDAQFLEAARVEERATRAEQRGDSLMYRAEAFRVMEESTAEDLLSKMPGLVVEGGTVQAQGETVKKVLVDGKEFFEGDINIALKNLPSDIIASIEVFDKMSEQAEFTGFDDGQSVKTINIVTKTGVSTGTFGRLYGGYGTDDRYNVSGNLNFFDGDRRISVLGMSNNVNIQNFSQEDISGVISASQSGRGGRRGGGHGGGGYGGGGGAANFMIGSTAGITSSHAAGFNYVDQWGPVKLTGSYFFNLSRNFQQSDRDRTYFESVLPGASYEQLSESLTDNLNHRVNLRMDYQINPRNSVTFRPSFSYQTSLLSGWTDGTNYVYGQPSNALSSQTDLDSRAWTAGGDLTFRHRFGKPGRTLSLSVNGTVSDNLSDVRYDNLTAEYLLSGGLSVRSIPDGGDRTQQNQLYDTDVYRYSLRGSLMYTEQLAKPLQFQANYRISWSNTLSDRLVYEWMREDDLAAQLNEDLSNRYASDYLTQSGGVGLRYRKDRFNVMAAADFQYASLTGTQTYPRPAGLDHGFFSVLPSLMAGYTINRANSLRLHYRSYSSAPGISSLQDVTDNSNPLFVTAGNPDLRQEINHMANLRYILTTASGHSFIAMVGATLRNDYVADSTFVADAPVEVAPGIVLDKGAQYTRPVNLDGYYSLQSMVTYGFPLDFLRSNLNLSLSANYAHTPSIFNGARTNTTSLSLVPKAVLGSNISERVDFTLSYSAGWNRAFSSVDRTADDSYVSHGGTCKLGWEIAWGITLNTALNYVGYTGLEDGDLHYFLLGASLGKKFLKNKQLEIRLEGFDLLNQNQSFSRTVGANYVEYVTGNVLQPYAMLSVVWNLRYLR